MAEYDHEYKGKYIVDFNNIDFQSEFDNAKKNLCEIDSFLVKNKLDKVVHRIIFVMQGMSHGNIFVYLLNDFMYMELIGFLEEILVFDRHSNMWLSMDKLILDDGNIDDYIYRIDHF